MSASAIEDIAAERATHEERGYGADHDRWHSVHHLVTLAEKYAHQPGDAMGPGYYDRTSLVKAASLLVAAIDLMDSDDES